MFSGFFSVGFERRAYDAIYTPFPRGYVDIHCLSGGVVCGGSAGSWFPSRKDTGLKSGDSDRDGCGNQEKLTDAGVLPATAKQKARVQPNFNGGMVCDRQ